MADFLSQLPKTTSRKHKRLGRGIGSGVGSHTVGRGQKGQKSRGGSLGLMFEGTKNKKSLVQRLPIMRGKNKFKTLKSKPVVITTGSLSGINDSVVNLQSLVNAGLGKYKEMKARGIKILNQGKLNKALTVQVPVSESAKANIESAGGKVTSS